MIGRELVPGVRPTVPRSPDEVDPEWLTGVLGARVVSVEPGEATAGTTMRRSLRVRYADPDGGPTRLFVKCTSSLGQRLMLGLGGLIHGEPGFYMRVRPGLAIEAPEGYFGAVDERSWHSIVVIEDVAATRQASFWRPGTVVDRGRIESLLAGMAAWHGALWESPRLTEWWWLRTPAEQMALIDALLGLANRLPAGFRRAAPVVPDALRSRHGDVLEALRRSMRLAAAGPGTYLHGDLHVANTYLTGDGRAGVADWQVGMQGSWAFDFAYLMATAPAVEDRRAWERELLPWYLERLEAAGGERVPEARALLEYRRSLLYPYFAWVYTLGRSRLQPAFQPVSVALTMVERIAAAICDLDALGALGV